VTELQPLSLHSEAYRFLGLRLLNARERNVRSVMALSAKVGQGNTSTITNLGITLAQAGQRVVIVDANIRTPRVHHVFDLPNDYGLTDLLQGPDKESLMRAIQPTSVPNLYVVTSGMASGNPWELFRSRHLQEISHRLKEFADYILYDTPSALAFTDAQNLMPVVDAALLCMRALEPPSGAEQRILDSLQEARVEILGCVLSGVPATLLDGFHYYQHYYPTRLPTPPALPGQRGIVEEESPSPTWFEAPNGRNGDHRHENDEQPALASSDAGASEAM
jgi:capsular exopolysaccharide synthesis family protein